MCMLSNTLYTNEVKDAAGAEIQFQRLSSSERSTEFCRDAELPASPHRLTISHQEIGTGVNRRRRSVVRFSHTAMGADTVNLATNTVYIVADIPIGNQANYDNTKLVLANLMSFLASTGADTTIKYDCTGNGAVTILVGSL